MPNACSQRRARLLAFLATPLGKLCAAAALFIALRTGILSVVTTVLMAQLWLTPVLLLAWVKRAAQSRQSTRFDEDFSARQSRRENQPKKNVVDVEWRVVDP